MAIVEESRPGNSTFLELGGSYAQPSASPHATWTGQTIRQMGWAGERNCGQPVYGAYAVGDNPTEIDARFRAMASDTLDRWTNDGQDLNVRAIANSPDVVVKNRTKMQLYSLAFA
jgi:hypothetical protein